jgi:hypothetical protein
MSLMVRKADADLQANNGRHEGVVILVTAESAD